MHFKECEARITEVAFLFKDIKTTLNIYQHLTQQMETDTVKKLESLYAAN